MVKYPILEEGDAVGIVSPSAGLAGIFRKRFEKALYNLKKYFKLSPKIGKHALKPGYIAGSPEERAEDINTFLDDPEVRGILTTIGGDHSIQLIPFIDFKKMKKFPKVFVGFSDITVLHLAFLKFSKVSTIYGPSLLYNIGGKILKPTVDYFWKAARNLSYRVESFKYTDEVTDWKREERINKKSFKDSKIRTIIPGEVRGRLFGGCLPSILRTAGTGFFPRYKGIAFLELPEGDSIGSPYPLKRFDADFSQLIVSGFFDRVKGLIFGIPYRYNEKDKEALYRLTVKRLSEYGFEFPIAGEVNIGHTRPILSLRYWKTVRLVLTQKKAEVFIL